MAALALGGCDGTGAGTAAVRAQQAISDAEFAGLVARLSERGGYFDTDNLISNEAGYLKVVDALESLQLTGAAYVGVGPGQNFSYIAALRPSIAFIVDIRRDNLLHHLLLKALMERAPTRIEFLAGLHGRPAPADPEAWEQRPLEELVTYVDSVPADDAELEALEREVGRAVDDFGVPLSADDHATIRRFHRTFVESGPDLRFTSFGRAPRPYYPTFRRLLLETDIDGDLASYLADRESYRTVRRMQLDNRVVPVVGDLAGRSALRELGRVMTEMEVRLGAFYTSNVEFYLWQAGTFDAWLENLAALPARDDAVVIRSYFPSFGRPHPSAVPGYYSTQSLQPISTLLDGGFSSYWDVVTRGIVELR